MTPGQIALALAVDLALLATAAGLLRRGRWRLCIGFVVYVTVVVASNLALVTWPDRFFKVWFWIVMHLAFEVARLWLVLEIAYRTFGGRSGVGRTARWTAMAVVGGIALLTMAVRFDENARIFAATSPWRLSSGSLFVILATLAVARAHRVTLHPFHATLLKSFAVYLVAFDAVPRGLSLATNWPAREFMSAVVEPFSYLALACWWLYAAWRRQSDPVPPQPGRLPVAAADPKQPSRPGGLSPQLALS